MISLIVPLLFPFIVFTKPLVGFDSTINPSRNSLTYEHEYNDLAKRANPDAAGLGRVGPGRPVEIVDDWEAYYNPLEALFPSQNSAQSLELFYNWVKEVVKHQANNNVVGNELELGTQYVRIRCETNAVFEWSVILKFLEWIVSVLSHLLLFGRPTGLLLTASATEQMQKTRRGWMNRYIVTWHRNGVFVRFTLMVAGLYGPLLALEEMGPQI